MIELHLPQGLSLQLREDQLRIQVFEAETAADPAATDLLQEVYAYLARHQILHHVARGHRIESVTIPLPRRA
jgi:hypothetical protein